MKVSLSLERSHNPDVAVMVDALRASTTMTVAVENFMKIMPVKDIENAKKLKKRYEAILAGEREGAPIEGFDTGNSPVEIQNFKGNLLVLTTTNGTRILEGMNSKTLIGSFINAEAVAEKALELADEHIEIVMAGVKGKFVIEDFLGAGEIISNMQDEELDETALAACMASQNPDMVDYAVKNSKSAKALYKLGLSKDVEFCLNRNMYKNVPVYQNGVVKKVQ